MGFPFGFFLFFCFWGSSIMKVLVLLNVTLSLVDVSSINEFDVDIAACLTVVVEML